VAEDLDPEFKPQYRQKKKKKNHWGPGVPVSIATQEAEIEKIEV
jgi:hypothetical protein